MVNGEKMKIIVAGGRDFNNIQVACQCIDKHVSKNDTIISGHARGADIIGELYASRNSIDLEIYPADWDTYGKRAGYIRNAKMADVADKLIAFWDKKSHGTKNMIEQAIKKKLDVIVYDYNGNLIDI